MQNILCILGGLVMYADLATSEKYCTFDNLVLEPIQKPGPAGTDYQERTAYDKGVLQNFLPTGERNCQDWGSTPDPSEAGGFPLGTGRRSSRQG